MIYAAANKVKTLIEQGENQFLEFKEQKIHPDSIAKKMAAFANTQCGTILIGISDQAGICDVDDSRNWEEWVANISRQIALSLLSIFSKEAINLTRPTKIYIISESGLPAGWPHRQN